MRDGLAQSPEGTGPSRVCSAWSSCLAGSFWAPALHLPEISSLMCVLPQPFAPAGTQHVSSCKYCDGSLQPGPLLGALTRPHFYRQLLLHLAAQSAPPSIQNSSEIHPVLQRSAPDPTHPSRCSFSHEPHLTLRPIPCRCPAPCPLPAPASMSPPPSRLSQRPLVGPSCTVPWALFSTNGSC